MIRVGVAGAAGRVGATVCEAIESADDLELTGRADPQLGVALADILGDCDVVVDFTTPDAALDNALACVRAGVHAVIGTTGWDPTPLREFGPHPPAPVFVAPNFGKLDAPSGTAARTAQLMDGEVPIHSVRLPGLVAHQEVILGDVGQTLTIRHDSTDRTSFVPGVLLAVRRVGDLPESPLIGLEHLL